MIQKPIILARIETLAMLDGSSLVKDVLGKRAFQSHGGLLGLEWFKTSTILFFQEAGLMVAYGFIAEPDGVSAGKRASESREREA
jgi:hypothetical protein